MSLTHVTVFAVFAALSPIATPSPASNPNLPLLSQSAAQRPVTTADLAAAQAQWQDIIRNLRHPDAKVRLASVQQLGNAGYSAAAEYVAPLVTDPDDNVQFAAIDAELTFFLVEPVSARRGLGGGGKSRAQEAFDAGPFVRSAASAPLIVVDQLIAAMRDKNERIRFDAVHAVGVLAESPLPPAQLNALLDGLDHYDSVVRTATARVLGRLRAAGAGEKLIAGLNDTNALARRYSAEALGLVREERAVASLTELTNYYGRTDMGRATLLALARIAHPSSLEFLRGRLSDADAEFRRAAAEGLGRLRDRDSLATLKTMSTSDPDASARLAATFAVGLLSDPQAHVIVAAFETGGTSAQARDYLLELGGAALPAVQAALTAAPDPRTRADLIHLLGFIGGRDGRSSLDSYVQDKDERVSRAATNAIARLTR